MAESSHPPSRVRLRNGGGGGGGGEIVEVQGGHIVRSTGRKDRHSKVCTAKGPRDRRVRLAAHTAIQFYDVQDRLGYDRPSKAVDWLIKKAKSSIDELAQLPPWHPTNCSAPPPNNSSFEQQHEAAAAAAELDHHHHNNHHQQLGLQHDDLMINSVSGASSKRSMAAMLGVGGGEDRGQSSSFLPPSLDSDAIADTIKSFFPMGASAVASSCSAAMQQQQFHSFPTPDFLQSRNTSHSQDLKLSLHSFQDPILLHHHHHNQQEQTNQEQQQQQQQHIQGHVLLSGIPLGFDGTSGWGAEHHHQQAAELSRFHRQQSWNSGGGGGGGDGGNYLFNSPSQPMLQQLLGQNQNQFVSQRGPLQSSNTPSIRAWMDPSATAMSTTSTTTTNSDQHYHHHLPIYPSGFGSGIGSFSGFNIPARIQGDQEVHDGYPDKPSSASSDSRH